MTAPGGASQAPKRVVQVAVAALAASIGFVACGLEPDVGPPLAGRCDNADTDPDVDVSFSTDIRPGINSPMGCGCHLTLTGTPGSAISVTGLDLSSLASLRAGGAVSGARIVIAGDPCASILYQKVSTAPPFGSRMPLGGPPFLNPDQLRMLHDWIAEGANDN